MENVWPGGGPWRVTAGGDIKPHKTRHHADFHLALRMSLSWVRQQGIEEDGTAGIIRERKKKKKVLKEVWEPLELGVREEVFYPGDV